jgi:hypothetical protein
MNAKRKMEDEKTENALTPACPLADLSIKATSRLRLKLMLYFALCVLHFASPVYGQQGGVLVDQIIALVSDDVITRSDLLWSIALDPKAPSPAGPVSRDILQRKLDVMIDQRLLAQEAARVPSAPITEEDVINRRAQLIASFGSEAAFRDRVGSVGLTPDRINELIREMIQIERFVEFRFRSFVLITDQDIQRYYEERFVAEMRKRGAVPPGLDDKLERGTVRDQIRQILETEKIEQEINRWIEAARQRADIVVLAEP